MAQFSVDEVFSAIDAMAPTYGFTPEEAKTIFMAENSRTGKLGTIKSASGDATNVNRTMGIMQVIPTTAEGLKQAGFLSPAWKHDPNNVRSQIEAGLAAMKEMRGRQKNPGDLLELGAMYNGGNAAWQDYLAGRKMNPETTAYLGKMRNTMADFNMTPQQIERAAANQPPVSGGAGVPGGNPGMRQSNSRSTSRSVYDSDAMSQFQADAGITRGLVGDAMNAVNSRTNGVEAAGIDLIASIAAAGEAAAGKARAEAEALAAGQARRAALLTRANLHPEQNQNRMDQALTALDETSARLDAMRPEIDRRAAVGFFDNPLEWIVNQTRLPGMVSEYNSLVQVQQDALGKYQAATGIAQDAITMSQAIDADRTLEVGNAIAQSQLADAKKQADQIRLQLQNKSAADALQAVQLGGIISDLSFKQLMITRQQEAERQGESEAAARRKGEEAALSDFNILVKAAGGEGINPDRFQNLPTATRGLILESTSTRRFGGDLADSMRFVDKFGNPGNLPTPVIAWLNKTRQAAGQEVLLMQAEAEKAGKIKSFDQDKATEIALNKQATNYQAFANSNMRGQSEANPYKIDYKSAIAAPEWAGNSWTEMLKKYGPDGTEKQWVNYDEQDMIRRAVTTARLSANPAEAVKKMTADISSFYRTAARAQQMVAKPQLFGMANPQKTYPVALPHYQKGNTITSLDLGNPVEVENFLTRQVAREIAEQNPYSIAGARASTATFGLVR